MKFEKPNEEKVIVVTLSEGQIKVDYDGFDYSTTDLDDLLSCVGELVEVLL